MSSKNKATNEQEGKELHPIIVFVGGPILILGLAVVYYFVITCSFPDDTLSAGTFGDSFGALNAIFSGCAFALLIYTAYLQRIELKLQRQDNALTREEFNKQSIEFESQNRLLKFDSSNRLFFELINNLVTTIKSLSIVHSDFTQKERVYGNEAIGRILQDFTERIGARSILQPLTNDNGREILENAYFDFYKKCMNIIYPINMQVKTILIFVNINFNENKGFYYDVLKSILTDRAGVLLFYDWSLKHIENKNLAEESLLFDYLSDDDLTYSRSELNYVNEYKIWELYDHTRDKQNDS
jgi:hypothetical protein